MINTNYNEVKENNYGVYQTSKLTGNKVQQKNYLEKSDESDIAVVYTRSNPDEYATATYSNPTQGLARATSTTSTISKSTIKDVQTKLNSIGYACGTPDGIVGNNTKSALMSFQKLCGLKDQSGQVTDETITRLNSVYSKKQNGTLARGLRNDSSVKKLQENLNKLGYNCGTPDGTFGSGTETAVKNFQKAHGLTDDGFAGSKTLAAITTALSASQKPSSGNNGSYNTVTQQGIAYTKSKEGCSLKPYNNGQTIGYGMDIANFPDVKINYQSDGSITQKEADRLFEIVYGRFADKVNTYLDSKNIKLDKYAYAAAVDLVYNRGLNSLTKEVIDAMGANNTQKVKSLLSDFDYRYAKTYLYNKNSNPDADAKAYVKRNPGLKTRRDEEYKMFAQKKFLV